MFRVSKNLFIYRLNERDNFWPQVPTIVLKKNKLKIFFLLEKKGKQKKVCQKLELVILRSIQNFSYQKNYVRYQLKKICLKRNMLMMA